MFLVHFRGPSGPPRAPQPPMEITAPVGPGRPHNPNYSGTYSICQLRVFLVTFLYYILPKEWRAKSGRATPAQPFPRKPRTTPSDLDLPTKIVESMV